MLTLTETCLLSMANNEVTYDIDDPIVQHTAWAASKRSDEIDDKIDDLHLKLSELSKRRSKTHEIYADYETFDKHLSNISTTLFDEWTIVKEEDIEWYEYYHTLYELVVGEMTTDMYTNYHIYKSTFEYYTTIPKPSTHCITNEKVILDILFMSLRNEHEKIINDLMDSKINFLKNHEERTKIAKEMFKVRLDIKKYQKEFEKLENIKKYFKQDVV